MAMNATALSRSKDMTPVVGSVELDIPIAELWRCFTRADLWPRWNHCMFWALNRDLRAGDRLIWAFEPLRWWLPYKLAGTARLVEVGKAHHVTWEVTMLPGFFARHTYFMEDLGSGRTRFGSWEQAMGPTFRLLRPFWLAHFNFVLEESLQGAQNLEQIYARSGALHPERLPRQARASSYFLLLLAAALLLARTLTGRGTPLAAEEL